MLTASATHEVASHTPLNCFLTFGTNLGIGTDPLGISFLSHYLLHPFGFLFTLARIVIVRLASEAKYLSTGAFYSFNVGLVDPDAVVAVISCAKLIISVLHDQKLTNLLPVSFQQGLLSSEHQNCLNSFCQNWHST